MQMKPNHTKHESIDRFDEATKSQETNKKYHEIEKGKEERSQISVSNVCLCGLFFGFFVFNSMCAFDVKTSHHHFINTKLQNSPQQLQK